MIKSKCRIITFKGLFMQLIGNNNHTNLLNGAHPTHVSSLVDMQLISLKRFLVSLWIRELHYVNNISAEKRMIQATTCYGERKDLRAMNN